MTAFSVDIHEKMKAVQRSFGLAGRSNPAIANLECLQQNISVPSLLQLNHMLMLQSFLQSPKAIGEADILMYKKMLDSPLATSIMREAAAGSSEQYVHLSRWFQYMQRNPQAQSCGAKKGKEAAEKKPSTTSTNNKSGDAALETPDESNKLILPNAEVGKVVTRFPPEASGFMHIGHAKAAFINSMLRDKYKGKLIFRFDDTNPAKEKESYEHSIIEDLAWLGIKPDIGPTYTSDYFDVMLDYCQKMLQDGTAYVDFTPVEEMRNLREQKIPTPCRSHTIEKNLELWEEMKKGTELGQTCCVRAKIDVTALNGTMRDPTMYRVVLIPHARTGTKYKVYPTYDFACPIVDSIEGVTHALRTVEYRDRNEQYFWFIEILKIRKPELDDYSRLNMEYTVMSKRKLAKLVDDGVVDGWDDPRFPTIRALSRKGLYPEALQQFVEVQGMSKVVNVMEWNKLWAINTGILNLAVPRYTAVARDAYTVGSIDGEITTKVGTRLRHKKNESLGEKPIYYGSEILLESADVVLIKEGEEITLMDWGNAFVSCIEKDPSTGRVLSCKLKLNLAGDVRKTKYKLSWLAKDAPQCTVTCYEFDNILSVKKPMPDDPNFDNIINKHSKFQQTLLGEGIMSELKKGDRLQIERRGYYIVDSVEPCLTLFAIPEGGSKINHLSAKAASGVLDTQEEQTGGKQAPTAKLTSGKSLEEKRAEKAAQKKAAKTKSG